MQKDILDFLSEFAVFLQDHKFAVSESALAHLLRLVESAGVDITEEERNAFMEDVVHAAKAIHEAFKPDKLNYGAYGDKGCHLHMHLVPKYEGQDEWGGTFEMNPKKTFLTDSEYKDMIEKIKEYL